MLNPHCLLCLVFALSSKLHLPFLSPLLNDSLFWVANSLERPIFLRYPLSWALYWVTDSFEHFFEWFTLMGNFMSPLRSKAKNVSTFLSTQKSGLSLKSPFLSGSSLKNSLLGTFWRALGPSESCWLPNTFTDFLLSFVVDITLRYF